MTLSSLLKKIQKRIKSKDAVIRRTHWGSGVAVIQDGRVYQGYHYPDRNVVYIAKSSKYESREEFNFMVNDFLATDWQEVKGVPTTTAILIREE